MVILKCFNNSQNITGKFLNEVEIHLTNIQNYDDDYVVHTSILEMHRIAQRDTNYLDMFAQKLIWKDGPLYYDNYEKKWSRNPYNKVALKCLYNSQNIIDEFLNEVKMYLENEKNDQYKITDHIGIYGISQNPDTKDYIMILQDEWIRQTNEIVALKCLFNSQNINDKFLNEVKAYSTSGLSKNINNEVSDNDNNKVSDEMAVEDLFIQDVENNEFSDNIAVEELLLQHTMQNWQ
ncbi:unnamed protein product [Rhizophagus irregularis]|nr:unnamed protein product [Rhizophagus irregularis]